ncbi:putative selenate reductase subunit YgfK [Raoultella terrigena]|uniref:Putative selenate reductase subunit YgfK n=1 Tax=Raoultella terrigena TaxID=577 RepID=A0A3P8M0I0_RAOTE|nr:putative selenate reductase subunit YgfK [Raoultella terrigena]
MREILDTCGFSYIGLNEESFDHDLKIGQALEMLHRLMTLAKERKLGFGVKLTNTLGTINRKGALPGDEMYISGRALFPLAINVAALLSREFDGRLPISYSGGASQLTIREIFETGIRPITMATDLLKPGGYLRLKRLHARAGAGQRLGFTAGGRPAPQRAGRKSHQHGVHPEALEIAGPHRGPRAAAAHRLLRRALRERLRD